MFDPECDEDLRDGAGVMYECSDVVSIYISECDTIIAAIVSAVSVAECISIDDTFIVSIGATVACAFVVTYRVTFVVPVSAALDRATRVPNDSSVIKAFFVPHGRTDDIQSDDIAYHNPNAVSISLAIGTSDDLSVDCAVSRQYNVRSGGGHGGE